MGNPLLGTVAFLSELFRGISALMLIPLISRFGYSTATIAISGSTALDVTLPVARLISLSSITFKEAFWQRRKDSRKT